MTDQVVIRAGRHSDLATLVAIYNHYVVHTHATYDTEPISMRDREEWLAQYQETGPHRLFVAECENDVIGYTTSSVFHPKPIYRHSIEIGIYVDPDYTGSGIGSKLYETLFTALAEEPDAERLVAGITLPNEASVALHQKFGFETVGTFHRASDRRGEFYDLCWFDRSARPTTSQDRLDSKTGVN